MVYLFLRRFILPPISQHNPLFSPILFFHPSLFLFYLENRPNCLVSYAAFDVSIRAQEMDLVFNSQQYRCLDGQQMSIGKEMPIQAVLTLTQSSFSCFEGLPLRFRPKSPALAKPTLLPAHDHKKGEKEGETRGSSTTT